jgi:NifU-like protein involved in Fe-S cluster formation
MKNANEYSLYSPKMMERFIDPKNMGIVEGENAVGEVGAAACFSGNTRTATGDGTLTKSLREIYDAGKIIPVWSLNLKTRQFEIKNAIGVFSGLKDVYELTLSDGGKIICTDDHEFLIRQPKELSYKGNKEISNNESIFPFKRKIVSSGYWNIRNTKYKKEHIAIFMFFNGRHSTSTHHVHHIDENKLNNLVSNLKSLSVNDHGKIHCGKKNWHKNDNLPLIIPREDIIKIMDNFSCKPEMANHFNVTTEYLIYHLGRYNIIPKFYKKNTNEIRKFLSDRMLGENNSYFKMTDEQKFKFASHPMETNPKWMGYSNEDLFKIGNDLYKKNGKLTSDMWQKNAKQNQYPQCLSTRFNSWNDFKEECVSYNHNIIDRKFVGTCETFTLQVEQNNNYVVMSRITKNVQEGIVVKNCGDIMRISLRIKDNKIEDAKAQIFGCGSAISAADVACDLLKGKTIEEAELISNEDVMNELGGVEEWKSNYPQKIHCSVLSHEGIIAALEQYKLSLEKDVV